MPRSDWSPGKLATAYEIMYKNTRVLGVKRRDPTFYSFDSTPACDRQMDGRTDTPEIVKSRSELLYYVDARQKIISRPRTKLWMFPAGPWHTWPADWLYTHDCEAEVNELCD